MAVLRDKEVLGLEVPVDDSFLMGRREAFGDLQGVVDDLPLGDRPRVQLVAQRRLFEELHHEDVAGRGAGDFFEGENRRDVRVVQCCERARLAPEPLLPVFILH